jgi:putative transcriptional regulator
MSPAPMHHPVEETLLRHAAGALPSARSLVVATHLPFCPDCQAAIRLGEAIGGALIGAEPPVGLTPNALTRALARLDTQTGQGPPGQETVTLAEGVTLPEALRGLARSKWRWLAPGISRIAVDVPGGVTREHAYLIRVAPGRRLPDHGHRGWEATCVLAGRFTDATGEYGPGDVAEIDVAETDGEVMHQPVAGAGESCICLIAWEGRLRMRGLLARLAQPLMGV